MCLSVHVCVRCPYICCVPSVVGSVPQGCWLFLEIFLSSAIGNLYSGNFFFVVCSSLCLNLPQPSVTAVCSKASPITMTITMAPTSVGLAVLDHHDVVLPPQLIPWDTMRDSVGLTTVLQQQQSQSEMPCQAYANYAMGPLQMNFLSQLSLPPYSLCFMFVLVIVFVFCFHVPM